LHRHRPFVTSSSNAFAITYLQLTPLTTSHITKAFFKMQRRTLVARSALPLLRRPLRGPPRSPPRRAPSSPTTGQHYDAQRRRCPTCVRWSPNAAATSGSSTPRGGPASPPTSWRRLLTGGFNAPSLHKRRALGSTSSLPNLSAGSDFVGASASGRCCSQAAASPATPRP
jgi:hypothetical protein